jgi:hypothetical protein
MTLDFELLEAFAYNAVLAKISEAFSKHSYRCHEFGDSLLIERGPGMPRCWPNTEPTSRNVCVPTAIGATLKCLQRDQNDAIDPMYGPGAHDNMLEGLTPKIGVD